MTHYLIDGYNWLFRSQKTQSEENLKLERDRLIYELSFKLSTAKMEATLIFDSHYNPGPAERAHARGISIYYTDAGQTADEYLLELIKYASRPQEYTIVSSDLRLACQIRQLGALTLPIHEFRKVLDRIFAKKNRPQPIKEPPPILKLKKTFQDRYEDIFTERLGTSEELPKKKPAPLKALKKEREPVDLMSDFDRWLRLFESK